MNLEVIQNRLENIKILAPTDPEAAHIAQDRLMKDFITYVAETSFTPAPLAREVLKVFDIKFPRYCA